MSDNKLDIMNLVAPSRATEMSEEKPSAIEYYAPFETLDGVTAVAPFASILSNVFTETLKGTSDFTRNVFPKIAPEQRVGAGALGFLFPIDDETEEGKNIDQAQKNLLNTGFGLSLLGNGIKLEGDPKVLENLEGRGKLAYWSLVNDPEVSLSRKEYDNAVAEIATQMGAFMVPYTGVLKGLNGVSGFTTAAKKLAGSKSNYLKYSPESLSLIMKNMFAVPAGVVLAQEPYTEGNLANAFADYVDPNDWKQARAILDYLSIEEDDPLLNAYGKLLVSDALIASTPFLAAGAFFRAGREIVNGLKNSLDEKQIQKLAVNIEARQLARPDVPVIKEDVNDVTVKRILPLDKSASVFNTLWNKVSRSTKLRDMRGQMSRQMYSLYTGASDAERNTSKFLNREVNILETSVERLIENLPHTEELAGRIASRYKMPTGFGSRTLTKIRSTEKASGVMRSKIWNQVNKALTEEIPISELPETLQPTVGIIRETLDTLTKGILDSPTLPPKEFLDLDDLEEAAGSVEEAVKDWANANKMTVTDVAEEVKVLNNIEELADLGDESLLLMPGLRATLEHNLGSYMRRSFRLHNDPNYQPASRHEKRARDFFIADEDFKFNRMLSRDEELTPFQALQKMHPRLYARTISELGDDLDIDTVKDKMFADVANTQIGRILGKGKEAEANELFANVALYSKSLAATGKAVFTRRKDIADPILKLMGEIDDPRARILDTASKLSHWVEQDKYFRKVKEIGEDVYLVPQGTYDPRFTATIDSPTSALHGMQTTPELAEIFSISEKSNSIFTKLAESYIMPLYAVPKAFAQKSATVLNVMTHGRNVFGNGIIHAANGWVPGPNEDFRSSFNEVISSLKDIPENEFEAAIQKYNTLGITDTGINVNQIRDLLNQDGYDIGYKDAKSFKHYKFLQGPVKAGKKVLDTIDNVYQAEDSFFKILAFKKERKSLENSYNDMGIERSADELDAEAAYVVKNTMPNYKYIPRFFRELQYVPFGNFFSYRYEEIRTAVNIAKRAIEEIDRGGEFRKRGLARLGGWTTFVAVGGTGLSGAINTLNNISEEEEQAVRETLPEWSQDSNIAIFRDEYGNVSDYIDISHNMPFDALQRWYPTMIRGLAEGSLKKEDALETLSKISTRIALDLARPFYQEDILGQRVFDIIIRRGKDENGRSVFQGKFEDDPIGNMGATIGHVMKGFTPGSARAFDRLYRSFTDTPDDYKRYYNPTKELFGTFTGYRRIPVDPLLALRTGASDLRQELSEANREFSSSLNANANSEDILNAYKAADNIHLQSFKRFGSIVRSAKLFGYKDSYLDNVLKEAGVGSANRVALLNNHYRPLPFTDEKRALIRERVSTLSPLEFDTLIKKIRMENRVKSGRYFLREPKAKGGVVNVPNAPSEPDERKMRLVPETFIGAAGLSFQDEEDRSYVNI